jgi:hypothetical protein
MRRILWCVASIVLVAACGTVGPPRLAPGNPDAAVETLWVEPADLESRDLFHGPGGAMLAPDTTDAFEFISEDTSGFSKGYEVRDSRGQVWSVKLGPESQTEVTVSRLLWALGYHQPPSYFVPRWEMKGRVTGLRPEARFRPELPDRKVVGEWSWYENDLLHSPAFRQLIVANVLVNNWDWKTSNNKIYEVAEPGAPVRRLLVVRDLGASLGKTAYPRLLGWFRTRNVAQGTRNDIEGFEQQGFIERVTDEGIEFDYGGIDESLLALVTPADVVRTCELMARLSDAQLNDAFRAAAFPPDISARYVKKLRSKIAEGMRLRAAAGISPAV